MRFSIFTDHVRTVDLRAPLWTHLLLPWLESELQKTFSCGPCPLYIYLHLAPCMFNFQVSTPQILQCWHRYDDLLISLVNADHLTLYRYTGMKCARKWNLLWNEILRWRIIKLEWHNATMFLITAAKITWLFTGNIYPRFACENHSCSCTCNWQWYCRK